MHVHSQDSITSAGRLDPGCTKFRKKELPGLGKGRIGIDIFKACLVSEFHL